MAKKKLLSNDPLEQEYQAKIVSTSMALLRFYTEAMRAIIDHQDNEKPEEDVAIVLDAIGMKWAKNIVDDISPKQTIIKKL